MTNPPVKLPSIEQNCIPPLFFIGGIDARREVLRPRIGLKRRRHVAHVRFTPESGHSRLPFECPLGANSGPVNR